VGDSWWAGGEGIEEGEADGVGRVCGERADGGDGSGSVMAGGAVEDLTGV